MHLIDAHVHIHPVFDLARFLDAAAGNFRRHGAALHEAGGAHDDRAAGPGCLLLTESHGADAFTAMAAAADASRSGAAADAARQVRAAMAAGWTFHPTGDACAVTAVRDGAPELYLFAGRQVVTAGRLEVLALLTLERFPPGLPLQHCIEAVQEAGGLPVLPWGFGKWIFGRRRGVEAALRESRPPLFMGDNGGRLRLSSEPALLRQARELGIPVLPGSDPLPFRREQERPGSYGFVAGCTLPGEAPATALRQWLRHLDCTPPRYGTRAGLPRFVANQVAMQAGNGRG